MTPNDPRIDAAIAAGLDAFWQAVADVFPDATGGDMAPGDDLALEDGARVAVEAWAHWNLPARD